MPPTAAPVGASAAGGYAAPAAGRPEPVLLVHNHYRQRGGEDEAVAAAADLLASRGHAVPQYTLDNHAIPTLGRLALARTTLWNDAAYEALRRLMRDTAPAVAHFHNTFPLVSPAAYYAARDEGVPVVQTLHNFRLFCPNGLLFRDGRPCEECLGRRVAWPGVVHACYRESRPATAVAATVYAAHHAAGTFRRLVHVYVTLTEFARRKFVAGGLPAERVVVSPNFLAADPGVGEHRGGYALFVGRLSEEKGIPTLMQAWRRLGGGRTLRVVGAGPVDDDPAFDRDVPGVEWMGLQPRERVMALMRDAAFLVLPSECYEGFPMTLLEAFATGLPVIASRHGAMGELVEDRRTGLHVTAGDVADLAGTIEWAFANPTRMAALGDGGRGEYEARYTPDRNYHRLRDIYDLAAERQRAAARA